MTRPTGIFSTTRNYNPGDEFILFGIQNLLRDAIGPFNTVLYNRNPAVQNFRMTFDKDATVGTQTANWYQTLSEHFSTRENAWAPDLGLDFADFAVFAGTPEWVGRMVEPLTAALQSFDGPVLYLGLGSVAVMENCGFQDLLATDQTVLRKARIVTVRDSSAAAFLAPVDPRLLPCPSLFAATGTARTGKRRLAVSLQGTAPTNTQRIDPAIRDYMLGLLNLLKKTFACTVIAHYVDELPEFSACLPDDIDVIYHADAAEYPAIYDAFDLVVTTRVHGAGLAAALGIPSFAIAHSHRSQTAEGFLAELVRPETDSIEDTAARIEKFDSPARSKELIVHQAAARKSHLDLLRPVLSDVRKTPAAS
ncbi:MAG: polysaccharide pyruvyl transferase family protein [Rhodospirillales bacterium]